jgi:hypothetical protein
MHTTDILEDAIQIILGVCIVRDIACNIGSVLYHRQLEYLEPVFKVLRDNSYASAEECRRVMCGAVAISHIESLTTIMCGVYWVLTDAYHKFEPQGNANYLVAAVTQARKALEHLGQTYYFSAIPGMEFIAFFKNSDDLRKKIRDNIPLWRTVLEFFARLFGIETKHSAVVRALATLDELHIRIADFSEAILAKSHEVCQQVAEFEQRYGARNTDDGVGTTLDDATLTRTFSSPQLGTT